MIHKVKRFFQYEATFKRRLQRHKARGDLCQAWLQRLQRGSKLETKEWRESNENIGQKFAKHFKQPTSGGAQWFHGVRIPQKEDHSMAIE